MDELGSDLGAIALPELVAVLPVVGGEQQGPADAGKGIGPREDGPIDVLHERGPGSRSVVPPQLEPVLAGESGEEQRPTDVGELAWGGARSDRVDVVDEVRLSRRRR